VRFPRFIAVTGLALICTLVPGMATADDRAMCSSGAGDDAIAACNRLINRNPKDANAYTSRGKAYYYKGDYDRAVADYDRAIARDPKAADAYAGRGDAYLRKGDNSQALRDYEEALRLDPNNVSARAGRRIPQALGDDEICKKSLGDDDTIAACSRRIAADAANADAYLNRSQAYRSRGEYDRAIADYSELIKLKPDDDYYRLRAGAYAEKGDFDHAIADYSEMIRLSRNNSTRYGFLAESIYAARGDAYYYRGDWGDYGPAIADYNEAIRLNPQRGQAYFMRSLAYSLMGDEGRALAGMDELSRLAPHPGAAHLGRSFVWRLKGEYGRAIDEIDEALKLGPENETVHVMRGEAWHLNGNDDRAISDLDEAIRVDPEFAAAYAARGMVYSKKGAYDRAIADLDRALKLDPLKNTNDREMADLDKALRLPPRSAAAYNARGEAWAGKGDFARAIADFDQALKLYANFADARQNRERALAALQAPVQPAAKPDAGAGTAPATAAPAAAVPAAVTPTATADATTCARGTGDDVIAACSRVLERDPGNAVAFNSRGSAYNGKGNYDRAIADFDQALKLNPVNATAYAGRGRALDAKGEHGRAIADYDQALMYDPGNAAFRQSREHAQAALVPAPGTLAAKRPETAGPQVAPSAPAAPPLRRVALVIGNSAYRGQPVLANPKRDATAIAETLRQAGFDSVDLALDLDRIGMVKALRAFGVTADRADGALVYFAGHGIEIDNQNYLVPVDATLDDDRYVREEAISYETLMNATGNARALRMLILDACRNNPFRDHMHRSIGMRSAVDRGLAPAPEPEAGQMIIYSAAAGQTAADDADGSNSPFARALIARMKEPGLEVRSLFEFVRDDVLAATGRHQKPFTSQSLPAQSRFYFVAGK
jgi:tetratricopeptide (TPR) repeat protein